MEVLYSLPHSWCGQHKSISQLNSSSNAMGSWASLLHFFSSLKPCLRHILYSLQHHSKPACGLSFLAFSFNPIQAFLQYIIYSFHHHSNVHKIYPLKLSSSLKAWMTAVIQCPWDLPSSPKVCLLNILYSFHTRLSIDKMNQLQLSTSPKARLWNIL